MSEVPSAPASIGVLTSGGDASGMNAAVRAVVLTAAFHGIEVYAVHEGYRGLVAGGDLIRRVQRGDVDGILQRGGTAIGTARSDKFRTREGRRTAARNMVERGIDALVVIGGDGSLAGANVFRHEWTGLLAELVEAGEISAHAAQRHPFLRLSGVVGTIDNDMSGTDMTIGTDTALHRIVDALDALQSTAASHQRTFVVEVMGRNCGYLALMSSLATAASWVFIPEQPPTGDWQKQMCADIRAGRAIGRRHSVVVVSEGARDRDGNPITSDGVRTLLEDELGEDVRITVLGHVQRGGPPSAFDRYLATLFGHHAVERLLADEPQAPAQVVGLQGNRVVCAPLVECVQRTQAVADRVKSQDYEGAMRLRSSSFRESCRILQTFQQHAARPVPSDRQFRVGIIHGGGPAPGMNTAVRAAVRLGLDRGWAVMAVNNGFRGLRDGDVQEMSWMDVSGWVSEGGADIGTNRFLPDAAALAEIAEQVAAHRIDALLMAGGWAGYRAAHELHRHRQQHPALDIPMVCMPITINNDVPATELSIGSDTALNSIVADVDKIRRSAVATRRVFIIEVRGHDCGYLAHVSGLATGAERIYLPEEGITLRDLTTDVYDLAESFRAGKRVGVVVSCEGTDRIYTSDFITSLFQKEGGDVFDAREEVLGHTQDGGGPSPFDRIQATTMTARSIEFLAEQLESGGRAAAMIGFQSGQLLFTDLTRYPDLVHEDVQRPVHQHWMQYRGLAGVMRD
ncbi:6-phosphofructokinase [Mycolicibacterium duvalii]|uniref:6-phosphofructokinase n=1 Tax=Mycolicibacterium duvalii TaxID=39688 RepID=A0A7I7JY25_9MYCO|nr:6-phosphofructokinase [Mycolicibacterium duvalii]MCV7366783.1 6-phosphofructokinase [Mycolicibacterium duvalii]PEG43914.1 6-phosphofructokinase [Mycolicibacterium duvalii]BBX16755.1 6-phosphofructokinase [Mycolicibacterium duvalii]